MDAEALFGRKTPRTKAPAINGGEITDEGMSCQFWFIEDNEVVRCGNRPTKEMVINGERYDLCLRHRMTENAKELLRRDMILRSDLGKIWIKESR